MRRCSPAARRQARPQNARRRSSTWTASVGGVLGAARIAREQVIPAIRRSGCAEVVAVSGAGGRARAYAGELGLPRAYDSHDELLADPDVDAVYLALPNALHARWILRAARAGKHVRCEKPLVLDGRELVQVDEFVAGAGVRLTEAFMYRHHPQTARLRELLDSGALGDLVAVQARLHFALARTPERDIRLRPDSCRTAAAGSDAGLSRRTVRTLERVARAAGLA